MVPHFWEQGSAGPTEAAVFNLYKFRRPRGCCYVASQGCPQMQCHLTHGVLYEARGLERGSSLPGVTQPVHGDQNRSQSMETRTQQSMCRRCKNDSEWGSPSRQARKVCVSCLWTLPLASTPQHIQLGSEGTEGRPVLWARSPAQLHELMNLRGWEKTKGSHGSGRKDMTPVHSFNMYLNSIPPLLQSLPWLPLGLRTKSHLFPCLPPSMQFSSSMQPHPPPYHYLNASSSFSPQGLCKSCCVLH